MNDIDRPSGTDKMHLRHFSLSPKNLNLHRQRAGAMLPLIAVVMVILFVAAVLSIDIARIHVTRSELRTATDAAARAAVEALGRNQNTEDAVAAALNVAKANLVAGKGLNLDPSQIVFGSSLPQADGTFSFSKGTGSSSAPLNAVRVTGSRTASSPDGSVGLLFGPLFGVTNFQPVQTAVATRTDRDIALVLDVSGSMASFGRFPALKNALNVFLTELENSPQQERVSLTIYSSNARKVVDLTGDLNLIRTEFAKEGPGGTTAIGLGIETGLDSILNDSGSRPFALKSIVVMTDGNWNQGVNPTIPALTAANQNVEVHAVTFSRGANQTLMRNVARIGGGVHLHADTNEQLEEVFQTIARQLKVLLIE